MSKRAVLYARVSYDDRGSKGLNLDGQLEMGREYAIERGYTVVDEIAEDDRGARGSAFDLPGLLRALEMAQAGEFDVLVVRELDRFARRLAKQLLVEEELKRAGVRVEYVLGEYPDTPEGQLNKNIRAVIAEYEGLKITERLTRARRLKVKEGGVMGHGRAPYGYRIGRREGKQVLEIHEPEARVVRMMFTWYTIGDGEDGPLSLNGVTRKLTEMAIPTAGDKNPRIRKKRGRGEWCRSVVFEMLKNETYVGVWHYGKCKVVRGEKRAGGEKGYRRIRNPESQWLSVEVPAVVSRETWEAAQRRLAENRENARPRQKNQYLMSRRVTCGVCGVKMSGVAKHTRGKVYRYYHCPANIRAFKYAHVCHSPFFRVDQVDAKVWEWVKSFMTEPAALQARLEEYRSEQAAIGAPIRERLAVVEDLLAEDRAQLERLLDLYLTGEFPKEVLKERKAGLDTRLAGREGERANLVGILKAQALTNGQVRTMQEFAAEVAAGLVAMADDFQAKRQVVDLLDVRVTLVAEEGEKVVYPAICFGGDELVKVSVIPENNGQFDKQLGFGLTTRIILQKLPRRKEKKP